MNIKQFTKEVQELTASMKAKARPYTFKTDFTLKPFWMELQKFQKKKEQIHREKNKHLNPIFQLIDNLGLRYKFVNNYHHRAYNSAGRFIDWYDGKKRSMLKLNGAWGHQGYEREFLIEEINKLASTHKTDEQLKNTEYS